MENHLSHKEILNFLKTEKAFLRNEFGVINIGIFGSYAKESQRFDSDIDMVVEIEQSKKNIHSFLRLKRYLEKEFSKKVDLGFEHTLKPIIKDKIKGDIIYA
jgi:predicted nucleotidyltransferase